MPLCGLHRRGTARQRQGTGADARATGSAEFATCRTSADSDDAKQNARSTLSARETSSDDADLDALRLFRMTTNRTIDRLCSRFAAYIGPRASGRNHTDEETERLCATLTRGTKAHRVHGRDDSPGARLGSQVHRGRQHPRGMKGARSGATIPGHPAEIGRRAGALLGYRKRPQQTETLAKGQTEAHQ